MSMSEDTLRLKILVRQSHRTNDHEVVLLGDDQDLVARFDATAMGLDPDDLLVEPCPLVSRETSECLVGRCNCGVLGCGDARVRIAVNNDVVSWSAVYARQTPVYFDLEPYQKEIARALSDHSWETPDRAVARLVARGVDRELLARSGLNFAWASGRSARGRMTVSLLLEPGPYQLLVHTPWTEGDPPPQTAATVIGMLAQAPSSWAEVVWFPQAQGLPVPEIAGSGWKRC
jgi:hypothetical protein